MKLYEIRKLNWDMRQDEITTKCICEYVIRAEHNRHRLYVYHDNSCIDVQDFDHSIEAMNHAQDHHEKALSKFLKVSGNGAKHKHAKCQRGDFTLIESIGDFDLYKRYTQFIDIDSNPIYGWGNGYVAIPKKHPFYGIDGVELGDKIYTHKGLTHSTDYGDKWLIGFDCHHSGDDLDNCSEDYVVAQVYSLYGQLLRYSKK